MMDDGGREGADSRIARPHFLPPIRLTTTMAEESIFNPETVIQRVAKVRNQWLANKSHPKSWKDADALVIVQGKFGEDVYHKPRIYQQYLLN
jgi:hypothetical protein